MEVLLNYLTQPEYVRLAAPWIHLFRHIRAFAFEDRLIYESDILEKIWLKKY